MSDKKLPLIEFIILMALMQSLVALSIDAMLPALPAIGRDLAVANANHTQLIVSMLILGMAFGQLMYGPLSDSVGRKPAIYLGLAIYLFGVCISLFSRSFEWMLIGRVLQGVGLSAPRVIVMALIRDEYEGRYMARIMSFIMVVFILVPALAPAIGQLILYFASWHMIFALFLIIGLTVFIWFGLRQHETLITEKRKPFSWSYLFKAVKEVCSHRQVMGFTIAMGLVFGCFLTYLSSAQAIFQDVYGVGAMFSVYFGVMALGIGSASLVNSRLVMRFGMYPIARGAIMGLCLFSIVLLTTAECYGGVPPLTLFVVIWFPMVFCIGLLFGNLNALAMQPLGHMAGIGASVIGSLSNFISVPLAVFVGSYFDQTLLPISKGFLWFGGLAYVAIRAAKPASAD